MTTHDSGSLVRPPPIRPGDAIAVVAPSGPFDRADLGRGVAVLEARGYRCALADGINVHHRYFAGADEHRLATLRAAWTDPRFAAVWCVRGGYGSMRLLSKLGVDRLPHKALVGFSDVTALHAALQAVGRASVHGPVITRLAEEPPAAVDRVLALLEGRAPPPLAGGRPVVPGRVRGRLLGGNLAVFTRLVGTPFFPDTAGAILVVEEVAERPYRLDRMWTHLRLAGALDRVAGVAVGRLHACEEPDADYSANEVMVDLLRELKVPSAIGFPIGHGGENHAVVLGAMATLDADQGVLEA